MTPTPPPQKKKCCERCPLKYLKCLRLIFYSQWNVNAPPPNRKETNKQKNVTRQFIFIWNTFFLGKKKGSEPIPRVRWSITFVEHVCACPEKWKISFVVLFIAFGADSSVNSVWPNSSLGQLVVGWNDLYLFFSNLRLTFWWKLRRTRRQITCGVWASAWF